MCFISLFKKRKKFSLKDDGVLCEKPFETQRIWKNTTDRSVFAREISIISVPNAAQRQMRFLYFVFVIQQRAPVNRATAVTHQSAGEVRAGLSL